MQKEKQEKTTAPGKLDPAPSTLPADVTPRLLEQMEMLAAMLQKVSDLIDRSPAAITLMSGIADTATRRAAEEKIDLNERINNALTIWERLTAPENYTVLISLADRLDKLGPLLNLLDQAPGMVAIAADTFDDIMAQAVERGVEPQALLNRGAEAAVKLKNLLLSEEFHALMETGVLHPSTLSVIGAVGDALVDGRLEETKQVGLGGILRALRDPDVQRAVGFSLSFARHFGRALSRTDA